MLTLGANQKDIDFETEWRRRMQACQIPGRKPHKPKGQLFMLETAIFIVFFIILLKLECKSLFSHT